MKKLNLNNIELGIQMPFSDITLDWLQQGTSENLRAVLEAAGANLSAELTVVSGCEPTLVNTLLTVSAGWMWHDNELIRFEGGSMEAASTYDVGYALQDGYGPNDPIQFVDTNKIPVGSFNVHQDRRIVLKRVVDGPVLGSKNVITVPYAFAPQFQDITLLNGATVVGFEIPQVWRDKNGLCYMRGQINKPQGVYVVGQLPPDPRLYASANRTLRTSCGFDGFYTGAPGIVQFSVGSNGHISTDVAGSGNLHLNGVSYMGRM